MATGPIRSSASLSASLLLVPFLEETRQLVQVIKNGIAVVVSCSLGSFGLARVGLLDLAIPCIGTSDAPKTSGFGART